MPITSELQRAIPLLPAQNIAQTIAFYVEQLGFEELFRYGEPADYAGVRRGAVELHLFHFAVRQLAENTSCRIVVTSVDDLYAEFHAAEVIHPNGQLATKPWGWREFTALDNNGVALVFCTPGEPGR